MGKNEMNHQDKYKLIDDHDNYQLIEAFQADFLAQCTIEHCRQRRKVYFRCTNKAGDVAMINVSELYSEKRLRRKVEPLTGKAMAYMDEWDHNQFIRKIMAAVVAYIEI
jgi:hypothetical protein